jgi:hypothetical protein
MLKALGDYGVYVIVVGIWPDDHLLTYYNGDLDGRVEDVRLVWSDDDLDAVLQVKISVQPLVLTYNRDRRRLFLADRSFLFYRQYGSPTWPWEKDETLLAALNSAPAGEQLNLDQEFPLTQHSVHALAAEAD